MNSVPSLNKQKVLELLKGSGTGYLPKDADLFRAGNQIIAYHNRRQGVISVLPEKDDPDCDPGSNSTATFCNIPGCNSQFPSVLAFESHYNSLHRFNCSQCRRNLPSAHLLDLHLEENHDSYFELLTTKKASFRCFLEECPERFWSQSDRRDHGIQAHKLPSNFRFATTTKEKKGKPVLEKMDDGQESEPVPAEVLKKSTVIKQKTITFGHNVPKSFDSSYAKALTKNDKKQKRIPANLLGDNNKMMVDLLESLPQ